MMREECALCKRLVALPFLRRCSKCGRLYCSACIAWELSEEGRFLCLNCARKLVTPKRAGTKYSNLSNYLARRARYTKRVTLSFSKIEEIIVNELPYSAKTDKNWWSNARGSAHTESWLGVGWRVENVDLEERLVVFTRPNLLPKKRRRKEPSESRPVLSTPKRKRRKLSKTKLAILQARLSNIERKRQLTKSKWKFK